MNKICPRCQGKKIFKKECCVKCGGKGYVTPNDRKLIKQIKDIYKKPF